MAATVEADWSAWEDAFGAGSAFFDLLPEVHVVPEDGYEHRWAEGGEHGDVIPLEAEDWDPIEEVVLEGAARAMATGEDTADAVGEMMGEILVDAVSQAIQDGRVEGDARTPEWEKRKGNRPHLVGLGDDGGHLYEHLTYEKVER